MSAIRVLLPAVKDRFPDLEYRMRKWRWRANWAQDRYNPGWRSKAIPLAVREAASTGWFLPGSSVLDIGCGSGEIAAWLTEQGYSVLGIDYAQGAIDKARRKYSVSGLEFETVDICEKVPGHGYQSLFDRGCFHVIPEAFANAYVRNVASSAAPGAHFLLLFKTVDPRKPKKETVEDPAIRRRMIARVEKSFPPFFEIVRVDNTHLSIDSKDAVGIAGVAVWMIRTQEP